MKNELLEEFAGFTELDSVSFGEHRMADLLKEKLKALGFETEEDDAAAITAAMQEMYMDF